MAWRLARSLVVLRREVRTLHPGTTVWDIGDADHQEEDSDHNPNQDDVVCATDTLGDARLDLGWYAEKVRTSGHVALKYVIYDRRIASARSSPPWSWRRYTGSNPHTGHVHVSVGVGPDGQSTGPYDDESPWGLLEEEDDMPTVNEVWNTDGIVETPGDSPSHPDHGGTNSHWTAANVIRSTNDLSRKALREVREVATVAAATLAAVKGEDVAQAAAQAARAAVRDEFAALGPALVAELGDVPAERVEAALRNVLGSLDDDT